MSLTLKQRAVAIDRLSRSKQLRLLSTILILEKPAQDQRINNLLLIEGQLPDPLSDEERPGADRNIFSLRND